MNAKQLFDTAPCLALEVKKLYLPDDLEDLYFLRVLVNGKAIVSIRITESETKKLYNELLARTVINNEVEEW